jgi:hypothetical protein
MRPLSRTVGLSLFIIGIGLMACLLYDASSVREFLGLAALASEGLVVFLGLALSAASLCFGCALWYKGREQDVTEDPILISHPGGKTANVLADRTK